MLKAMATKTEFDHIKYVTFLLCIVLQTGFFLFIFKFRCYYVQENSLMYLYGFQQLHVVSCSPQ